MPYKSGRAWHMTRASVTVKGKSRPRSNKYSHHDHDKKPAPRTRTRIWVGAYDRPDGIHVKGHYRAAAGSNN
jgi:hypothetical protein